MEKETATEWLFKQLWDEPKDKLTWNTILMKAKEIEKEQMIEAYDKGEFNQGCNGDAEQYFNETFKNK